MNLQRREHMAQMAGARREIASVDREIGKLVQAIKDGVSALAIKNELVTLEARKAALMTALAEPPLPALHPNMAEVFARRRRRSLQAWSMTNSATLRDWHFAGFCSQLSSRQATGCCR